MTELAIHRVTAMPGSPDANAIYMVAPAARPDYVEIYVTGNTGAVEKRVINEADIQALIDTAVAAAVANIDGLKVVADIAERDALSLSADRMVLVKDASADPTVTSGGATYAWDNTASSWDKVSETESLDLVFSWSGLTGKPTSAVGDIDDAVSKRHSHANATELAKLGQNANGNLTYDGDLPKIGWDTEGW